MSNWIQTFSRHRIDYEDPKPDQVKIEDIARALARLPRFLGHTREFYSVAQHSVGVCKILPFVWPAKEWAGWRRHEQKSLKREALLHDAVEAYTGDLPTPAKKSIGLPWREMERRVDRRVRRALNLLGAEPWPAKVADQVALYLEATGRNIGVRVGDWDYAFQPRVAEVVARLPESVKVYVQTPLEEKVARRHFLSHYRRLTDEQ